MISAGNLLGAVVGEGATTLEVEGGSVESGKGTAASEPTIDSGHGASIPSAASSAARPRSARS